MRRFVTITLALIWVASAAQGNVTCLDCTQDRACREVQKFPGETPVGHSFQSGGGSMGWNRCTLTVPPCENQDGNFTIRWDSPTVTAVSCEQVAVSCHPKDCSTGGGGHCPEEFGVIHELVGGVEPAFDGAPLEREVYSIPSSGGEMWAFLHGPDSGLAFTRVEPGSPRPGLAEVLRFLADAVGPLSASSTASGDITFARGGKAYLLTSRVYTGRLGDYSSFGDFRSKYGYIPRPSQGLQDDQAVAVDLIALWEIGKGGQLISPVDDWLEAIFPGLTVVYGRLLGMPLR